MIEFQIRKDNPRIPARELSRRVAERMYLSDAATRRLLDAQGGRDVLAHDLRETMSRISAILGELGLRYHFTGGIASSYYGDPRFTQDVDLVIQLTSDRPETTDLLDRLSSGYLIEEQVARDAISRSGLFQALDEASMVKIDFHVGEKIPGELGRSRIRELSPGLLAPLVCKEDAILSKLLWIQQGSGKARHDVKMMLSREEDLDRACLRERAEALGLVELLAEFEREL
jgi:hypothetical protein